MFRYKLAFILSTSILVANSQNDLDAIRYSRVGGGGSARFMAMGGAFGAVGADLSTAAYNPAGLGIYRKGEVALTAGFRTTTNEGSIHNTKSSAFDLNPVFNNFGFAAAWHSEHDPESRHVIAFSNTQLQNFHNSTRISGYTNNSSIAKDMLNLAQQFQSPGNDITANLNYNYEWMGFNTYLLDTADNQFFSFVDLKRSVKQTRDIVTSGRVNDLNFSYAYAYKDKFYLGASVGLPQLRYESTVTHTEFDDLDSMQVILHPNDSISTTYIDDLPVVYLSRLGFDNLEYTEYFKTTGNGINLKLGGIARVSDMVRVGIYYHTPTVYRLQDNYYNSLSVTFDGALQDPGQVQEPEDGGFFKYRVITPGKVSTQVAVVIKKLAVIGIDYEMVNYKSARLASENISDFEGPNELITSKYKVGHNFRLGGELNLNPFMVRVGYNMQGSPFGEVFAGDFVRNTVSAGFGFRTKSNFYFDFVLYRTQSSENYYPFNTLDTRATLVYKSTTLAATLGLKF